MSTTRRNFLKLSTLGAAAAAFGVKLLTLGEQAWAQTLALVDMSKTKRKDPENEAAVAILSGMGYVEDADKAEKEKKISRPDRELNGKKVPGSKTYCTNCILMEDKDLNTGKPGKCKVVATALVHAKGYCNTYGISPKAKV